MAEKDRQAFVHVEALMDLFCVFTKDDRYREVYENALRFMVERGDTVNMCSVIDYYVEKGMEKGLEKGISTGIRKGRQLAMQEMIGKMLKSGKRKNAGGDC